MYLSATWQFWIFKCHGPPFPGRLMNLAAVGGYPKLEIKPRGRVGGFKVWEHHALRYECEITYYHKAYVDEIGEAINEFPRVNRFANVGI